MQIHDGKGRRVDPLRDVAWIWGIDDYPGLNRVIMACYNAYQEAHYNAYRRRFPAQ